MRKPDTLVASKAGFTEDSFSFWKQKKILFPLVYIKLVILAFAVTGLNVTVLPGFKFCVNVFGEFCEPIGNLFFALISLPGYIAVPILTKFIKTENSLILFLMALLVSVVFYYLLGTLSGKLKIRGRKLLKLENVIIGLFLILLTVAAIMFAL